jgi:membrane peptidoglycan carboxypeptidase
MGIDTWEERSRFGLSLTLGGGEATMLDMAEVYGTLANGGVRHNTNPIIEVTDYLGKDIDYGRETTSPVKALEASTAWIISHILMDNQARSQAFGLQSQLVIPNKSVAVKTGTTNEKRDNWTIGYTPSYVTTVWVGNNDNTPMNPLLTSGVTGAAPIWRDVMIELLSTKAEEVPSKPDSVIAVPCYRNSQEYFVAGTEPKTGGCGIIPTLTPTTQPQ